MAEESLLSESYGKLLLEQELQRKERRQNLKGKRREFYLEIGKWLQKHREQKECRNGR